MTETKTDIEQRVKKLLDTLPSFGHYAIHDTIQGKEVKILRCDKYSNYALTVKLFWKEDVEKLVTGLLEDVLRERMELKRQLEELLKKKPPTAIIGWGSNPVVARKFDRWFRELEKVLAVLGKETNK